MMKKRIHSVAGLLAALTIASFLLSTVLVELFGSPESLARVKSLIVLPGLLILVPAIMATGGAGVALSKLRPEPLAATKKKRMPLIAANGAVVLIPCAIVLDMWASQGNFGTRFYLVQALELLAGGTNLALMCMNIRDGLKLSGRLRHTPPAA